MLIIRHQTELSYSEPIAETVMQLRVTPLANEQQALRGHRIDVGPNASLLSYRDWLNNTVHQFSLLTRHDRIVILAQSAVEMLSVPQGLRGVSFADEGSELQRTSWEFLQPSALLGQDDRLADLARRLGLKDRCPAAEAVEKVMQNLCSAVTYRKGVTSSTTTLKQVLDEGAGVCQDLAHVSIALLRARNIPVRYTSGYYYPLDGPPELETHAWCEVFSTETGWVGVDPTHRSLRGRGHVAVAVGRDYSDVPPNRGVFVGNADETISVTVSIEETDSLPEGVLAPRAATLEVPTLGDGPRVHSESLDYQQEQQQQ